MRCTVYIPGLWHLGLVPRFSGYACPIALLVLLVCGLASIGAYTYHQSALIYRASSELDKHPLADKKYAVAMGTDVGDAQLHYGVVIDCGSSGSRVYVYYWPPHAGAEEELLSIQALRDEEGEAAVKKIEPGISDYATRPSSAAEYLRPLLAFAAERVPISKHKETPLYIMATAGMRMLSESDQEAILGDLRVDIPLWYGFLFAQTHVEVITGKQEGVFAWVAINYALGKFDHKLGADALSVVEMPGAEQKTHIRKRTVGIIDMGGGSLQVAFEVPKSVRFESPKEDVAKSLMAEFSLGCTKLDRDHLYRVYVSTFLGFGANSAREAYEQMLVSNYSNTYNGSVTFYSMGSTQSTAIPDPCLPVQMLDTVQQGGRTLYIRGTGSYDQCQENLQPLLNKSMSCMKQPCSLNGVFQPYIDFHRSEFFGFSEFYYTMEDILRISGKYEFNKFKMSAKDYCSTSWSVLQGWFDNKIHPRADMRRFEMQCFKSAWITTVLHEGLKFPKYYKHLTSLRFIDGREVHWTRGALLYKTKYYPLRDMEQLKARHYRPAWMMGELQHAYYLLLLCFLVVVAAIFIYLRRLRLVRRPDLRRVPTMSYFMVEEGQEEEGVDVHRGGDYPPSDPYQHSYFQAS